MRRLTFIERLKGIYRQLNYEYLLIEDFNNLDKEKKRKLINYLDSKDIAWCIPPVTRKFWRNEKYIEIWLNVKNTSK